MEKTNIENQLDSIDTALDGALKTKKTGAQPAPFARTGENIMGSRPFSYARLVSAVGTNGWRDESDAKIEMELCKRFKSKAEALGWRGQNAKSVLVPFWPDGLSEDMCSNDDYKEIKSIMQTPSYDKDDELNFRKASGVAITPAQSWVDQSLGGSYVPPPVFASPIDLLRNSESIFKISQIIPMGPSGRIIFPRELTAIHGQAAAENTYVAPTTVSTGQLALSSKKYMATCVFPSELLRYSQSGMVENMIRNSMYKTVSLLLDKDFLDGPGSDNRILGVLTMARLGGNPYSINLITPTGASANDLSPQDFYTFEAAIEENNAVGSAWLMRPKLSWAIYASRWNDNSVKNQGGFVFDLVRGTGAALEPMLAGLPIVRSTNISAVAGNGAQTSCILIGSKQGDVNPVVGLFGAIELATTDQGSNLFLSDQTAMRAIMLGDAGLKWTAAVSVSDPVNFSVTTATS